MIILTFFIYLSNMIISISQFTHKEYYIYRMIISISQIREVIFALLQNNYHYFKSSLPELVKVNYNPLAS